MKSGFCRRFSARVAKALLLSGVVAAGVVEFKYSPVQSFVLSQLARSLRAEVKPGASATIRFPEGGPHDLSLGYALVPKFTERLTKAGFAITRQAHFSLPLVGWTNFGLFPPYREKARAGLDLVDANGLVVESLRFPGQRFEGLEELPDFVVRSLLFIEDRNVLDRERERLNPAVEWDRLGKAALSYARTQLVPGAQRSFGGSTLATQLEKFRHSPGGRTSTAVDKFVQVASASVRSYLGGAENLGRRSEIVLDYLNNLPLAAVAGVGPVNGLADGLRFWFGADARRVMYSLRALEVRKFAGASDFEARAFRQILGLLIATRRPAHYLSGRTHALADKTDSYLRALAAAGVVPREFARTALRVDAPLRPGAAQGMDLAGQVGGDVDELHAHLMNLLGTDRLYDLLRYDLVAQSSVDAAVSNAVREEFLRLSDPAVVEAMGLNQHRILAEGDPSRVRYTLLLAERGEATNLVRVEADNQPGAFRPNSLMKMELGSTAKLRTLVTYLEVIAEIHARHVQWDGAEIRRRLGEVRDPLSRWVLQSLLATPKAPLETLLRAALARQYSASPEEGFFTGGGLHHFNNFEHKEDAQIFTVAEALRDSVNLVFVRLMRDIVSYHMDWLGAFPLLEDSAHPHRISYLENFILSEGRMLVRRFDSQYRDLDEEEITERLMTRLVGREKARGYVEGYLFPEKAERQLTLVDVAFLSRIHPLDLWVARFRLRNPDAPLADVLKACSGAIFQSYSWLLKAKDKRAQDLRIRTQVERAAFEQIHRRWQRLGYPFGRLVPSLATALGSSGDRPTALAELMGILVQDGMRYPLVRMKKIEVGKNTPYETTFENQSGNGVRVLPVEVARVTREALRSVVEEGTARRMAGAFVFADGTALPMGGKTGTGDNRRKTFDRGGSLVGSEAINRTATFVFFLGDRHFGVITAFVEQGADDFSFTSALPVQVLRNLATVLRPVVMPGERQPAQPADAGAIVSR